MSTYLEFSSEYETVDIPDYTLANVGDFFEVDIDYIYMNDLFQMPFNLDYAASTDFFAITKDREIHFRINSESVTSAEDVVTVGRNLIRLQKTGAQEFKAYIDGVEVAVLSLSAPSSPKVIRINRGDGGAQPNVQWCQMNLYAASTHDRTYDLGASSGTTLVETQQGLDGTLESFTTGGFVTVAPPADAPTADAGLDQSGINAGDTVTLDGSGSSDPNSLSLTYQWTQIGGASVTLSDNTAQSPTFTAPSLATGETLTFRLIVSNGTESSAPDSVDIGVLADSAPQSFDVILLIGQSNMVGRYGPIDYVLDAQNSRVFQYGSTRQTLEPAYNPLDHLDETSDTVGLGLSLAKHYADNYLESGRGVLLVPAADGGTGFSSGFWREGGTGYNNAIARANEAIALGENSRIVMMAWHQGETDRTKTESQYASDLDALISGLRSSISGASDCPFIVGEVSPSSTQYGAGVAAALANTPTRVTNTAYVQTSDLALGGDNLHFTAASSRTIGERYSVAYQSAAQQVNQPPIANAGPDQSVEAGVLVQVSASASSDSDGTIVGYKWRETTNSGVVLSSTTAENISFTSPVSDTAQTVTLELIVTDDGGLDSAPVTVNVEVQAEVVPVIESTLTVKYTGMENKAYTTVVVDVDNNEVLYNQLSVWTDGIHSFTFAGTPVGTNVKVSADDGLEGVLQNEVTQ